MKQYYIFKINDDLPAYMTLSRSGSPLHFHHRSDNLHEVLTFWHVSDASSKK